MFADPETGVLAGLWRGGDHGDDTQKTSQTDQCHDITAYPALGIAAGACSGNGIIFDISDPLNPQRIDEVVDRGFAYWHSATFNNDGTKVLFTDEWGGGSRPRCRAYDPLTWGADAFYDIVDGQLEFRSYFKMPAPQVEQENCVAHNGSIVPVPGRDIFVQAWYQGGISVIDFTDSANPVEIAYFDRGPINAENLVVGGFWSAYCYHGRIYGTEIVRGLDVLALVPSEHLSENEIAAAAVADQGKLVQPAAAVPRDLASRAGRGPGIHRSARAQRGAIEVVRRRPEQGAGPFSIAARGGRARRRFSRQTEIAGGGLGTGQRRRRNEEPAGRAGRDVQRDCGEAALKHYALFVAFRSQRAILLCGPISGVLPVPQALVTFLLGCSFSFEHALMANGIDLPYYGTDRNVPMFITDIETNPAGPFFGSNGGVSPVDIP